MNQINTTPLEYASRLVECIGHRTQQNDSSSKTLLQPLIRFRLDPSASFIKWLMPNPEEVLGLIKSLTENQTQESPLFQPTTLQEETAKFSDYINNQYKNPILEKLLKSLAVLNEDVSKQYLNPSMQKITPLTNISATSKISVINSNPTTANMRDINIPPGWQRSLTSNSTHNKLKLLRVSYSQFLYKPSTYNALLITQIELHESQFSLPELENLNNAAQEELDSLLENKLKQLNPEPPIKVYGLDITPTNNNTEFVVPYVFTSEVMEICQKAVKELINQASEALQALDKEANTYSKQKRQIEGEFKEKYHKLFTKLIQQLRLIKDQNPIIDTPTDWMKNNYENIKSCSQENFFHKESDAYPSLAHILNFAGKPFNLCQKLPEGFENHITKNDKPYYGASRDYFSISVEVPQHITRPTVLPLPANACAIFKTNTWHNSPDPYNSLYFKVGIKQIVNRRNAPDF